MSWYSAAGQWGSDASGGIFAQRFDAIGTATGVEFHVNTSTDGTQYDPYVVDLQDGGFAVLWTSHETRLTCKRMLRQRRPEIKCPQSPQLSYSLTPRFRLRSERLLSVLRLQHPERVSKVCFGEGFSMRAGVRGFGWEDGRPALEILLRWKLRELGCVYGEYALPVDATVV